MTPVFSMAFVAILTALAIFQLLLVTGRPWGRYAWGGQYAVLPKRLRIGSAFSVVIYSVFAFVALERAGITAVFTDALVAIIAMWVIAGYLILSVLPNVVSKSVQEKRVMTPVSVVLASLAVLIAVS